MKGILKIYHPDETLKYNIRNTYCKAVYSNQQHFLEVEIITDDSLDHVEDDSLQYNFHDEDAFIYDNELQFDKNEKGELQVVWKGTIDDFYTGSETPIPFRLKCEFSQDDIEVDED